MKRFSFLGLLLAMALQGLALYDVITDGPVIRILLAHLVSSLLWGWSASALLPEKQRQLWWLPASCALIFPVLGPLASLMLIRVLCQPPPEQIGEDYVIWENQTSSRWKPPPSTPVSAQIIVEILQSPLAGNRRNAILSLRNLDPRLSIPLLRKGLLDSDEQVRIYAQNILSDILIHFEERIKDLEQAQQEHPEDPQAALRLAEYYFELVYLDVAGDSDTDAHHLAKALELLKGAHQADPTSRRTSFLAMKYALRAADIPEAKKWLAILEQQNFDANQLMPWRLEIAYLQRDWPTLRALFAEYDHIEDINPRIGQIGRFWFGQQKATA